MANYFSSPLSNVSAVIQGQSTVTINSPGTQPHESEKWKKCLRGLRQMKQEDIRQRLMSTLHSGFEDAWETILENDNFQRWKSGSGMDHALVLGDGAGATGTTALTIFITNHLEHGDPESKNYYVLYYFCASNTDNRDAAASILKGLIRAICDKDLSLTSHLQKEWDTQGDSLFDDHQIEALWAIFKTMIDNCSAKRVYCVIDGIDSCGIDTSDSNTRHNDTLRRFLRQVNNVFAKQDRSKAYMWGHTDKHPNQALSTDSVADLETADKLRMLILTRNLSPMITSELGKFPQLELDTAAKVDGLIERRVRRVSTICSKNKDPSEEMLDIVNRILSSGPEQSFLFVGLLSEKLEKMTLGQLRKYEKTAPKNVAEFYRQLLLNVPPKQRPATLATLKWVALAERPLTTLQLTKAVKYFLNKSFSRKSLKNILESCHGMMLKTERRVAQGKTVKIEHPIVLGQQVFDLLFDNKSPLNDTKQLREFVCDKDSTHSELANSCVSYLQDSACLDSSRKVRLRESDELKGTNTKFFSKHPFLEYAIINWTYHAKRGKSETIKYNVPFFGDKLPRRRLWWESYWISLPLRQWMAWKWTTPSKFSLLHLAAFFDIVSLAKYVEEKGLLEQLLHSFDSQGMKPINWATEKSSSGMVQFLLERGDFDNDCLLQAARTGEVSILRMLLENRFKRQNCSSSISSPSSPSSPLQSLRKATMRSLSDFSKHSDPTEKAKLSPMSPTDASYGKTKSETPLHIAAACGHEEAVTVLIEANEDVDKPTDGGWAPIHNAAWFGRVAVVDRLINRGAKSNVATNDGLTPLHCAVKNSQVHVVELLLDKKLTDMEAQDRFGNTPFHMACKCHELSIMEILHSYGADIERRMRIGWTPLMWAAVVAQGYDVAKWLLEHDADVNPTWIHAHKEAGDSIELNALDLAKSYRREGLISLLRDRGAVDNKSIASRSSIDLPLPESLEETYDLPESVNNGMPHLERTETQDSQLSDDEEDESDDQAESESDDESTENESLSRHASTSSIEDESAQRRKSSSAIFGLGILAESETGEQDEVNPDLVANPLAERCPMNEAESQPIVVPIMASDNDDSNTTVKLETSALVDEPQPYNGIDTDRPNLDGDPVLNQHSAASDQFEYGQSTPPDASDRRKSSGAKSPNAIGDMFDRIKWKKIGSFGGIKESHPIQNDQRETAVSDVAGREDSFDTSSSSPVPKESSSVFGKFQTKRGFSWRKDTNGAKAEGASADVEINADDNSIPQSRADG